ncbi:MAG: hypothetical protein KAW41_02160 [Candidatus Diapherotrites archaeon]|nr:hypothetical protein [Candidatus Diapherotrites archaeon]
MDGLAASVFAITSAGLMGYSFALLLVVRKKQEGKKRKTIANMLPLFSMLFMLYFALESFAYAKEILGTIGMMLMFYMGYKELAEARK